MDLLTRFDETHQWISEALAGGGVVLVHCFAGISRSASVVIAYVMKEMKLDYSTARTLVSRSRSVISPNEGFVKQLSFYEKLGCNLEGSSPAHTYLRSQLLANDGRLDTALFMRQWQQIQAL